MKKFLAFFAGALILFGFAPPTTIVNTTQMTATYLPAPCSDTVTAPAGTGVVITGKLSGLVYTFHAQSTSCEIDLQIKDVNGGTIQAGDSLWMKQVQYTICGTAYVLRRIERPTITFSGSTVTIHYSDCILPLNGTSGECTVSFVQ
jgi:hypothetical protein